MRMLRKHKWEVAWLRQPLGWSGRLALTSMLASRYFRETLQGEGVVLQ